MVADLSRGVSGTVSRARIESHRHPLGEWLLATRQSAPDVLACVPQYIGYEERSLTPIRRLEVPHPNITLIINLGAPLEVRAPAHGPSGARFGSFVAGLFDTVVVTQNTGDSCGIEMNLTPLGMWQLLGLPMHEFMNRIIPFDALIGTDGARLEEQLRNTQSWDDRFDLLDSKIAALLARRASPSREVRWAVDQIARPDAALTVSAIANELRWSRRRLVASFREHIGMTPKAFARITRFDRAVRRVRDGPIRRWSLLAYECGYADQAHLTREFREFAGLTPTEFQRRQGAGMAGIAVE